MEAILCPTSCRSRRACMKQRLVSGGEWEENWWREVTETCWLDWKNACTSTAGITSKTSRLRLEDGEVTFAAFQASDQPNDLISSYFSILLISLQSSLGGSRGNDVDESGFQRRSSDQESIDVLDLDEFIAVLFGDAASVDDAAVAGFRADLAEVLADPGVDLVDLLGGCGFAGSDGPDWLVGEDQVGPVALSDVLHCIELPLDHFDGAAFFPFQQRLSEAKDHLQLVLQGGFHLLTDQLVDLSEMRPPLRMAQDDPADVHVDQLLGRHLARKGSVRVRGAVLSGNLNVLISLKEGDGNEMQVNRRDHHFYLIWVELQLIEQRANQRLRLGQ